MLVSGRNPLKIGVATVAVFYRLDALPNANEQCQSAEGRQFYWILLKKLVLTTIFYSSCVFMHNWEWLNHTAPTFLYSSMCTNNPDVNYLTIPWIWTHTHTVGMHHFLIEALERKLSRRRTALSKCSCATAFAFFVSNLVVHYYFFYKWWSLHLLV